MQMNRRAFLKLAGFAAAACAVPPVFSAIESKPPPTLRGMISHVEIFRTDGKTGPIFEVPDSWFVSPMEMVNGRLDYGPATEACTFGGLRFFGPGGDVYRMPFNCGSVLMWHGCTASVENFKLTASYV
jgi:hypothetical protein